ncbi:tRNA 2-thiouridine(34) synthase MnmA [Roseomonas sp. SSH11]|uniref:tRNA-specific 2-thiouridylase MnmA n=1 Tax=Pararoseomonas baculiformis TaxID=2820812 RepID=A0ABS4AE13_9PROT|nr:tRNA 2-thiouridine(34) synthase MnmA [Pararoseomonas baculiformis]MBP0445233.1 tRNA 2-thiouridine(34) synthase MnmA [Pararoseomonas baculiformis]
MRIMVAMSGGVDSSVVAGLLAEQGHDVIGATLQLYDHGAAVQKKGACCAGQDIHDARDVADRLGIPHYVLDRESRFRDAVIGDFADSYARGETPIPCVRCNQTVKFQDLVALARDLGCDALATGHYARRVEGPGGPELHRAADPARDQSYFLFATTREQLGFARFPLGDMPDKAAVRREAARLGLAVAEKADSQDICFVPTGRYHDLVAKLRPEAAQAGEIVDTAGRVLGQHQGMARYTVGQARGLGLPGDAGLRVAALDAGRRRIVVAPAASIPVAEVPVAEVNWLMDPPAAPFRAEAKFRAREVPQPVTAEWDAASGRLLVRPDTPVISAPGQGCVLYDGDRVLCGGFIRATRAPVVDAEAPAA